MERSRPLPALVRPQDLAPGRQALIVTQRTDDGTERPSPFAGLTWRLVLSADRTRRSHGVA